jgi:hypothetical protein
VTLRKDAFKVHRWQDTSLHYVTLSQELLQKALHLPQIIEDGFEEAYMAGWTPDSVLRVLDAFKDTQDYSIKKEYDLLHSIQQGMITAVRRYPLPAKDEKYAVDAYLALYSRREREELTIQANDIEFNYHARSQGELCFLLQL